MPVGVWLAVCALACARISGLIVQDEITRPAREGLLRRLDERRLAHRLAAYLVTCVWCVSIYVGAAVAAVAVLVGPHPVVAVPVAALAFSQVAGMLSGAGRGE